MELGRENPLASTEFRNVSMHDKVDIVYSLCLYRLDTEDVNDAVKVCNCIMYLSRHIIIIISG